MGDEQNALSFAVGPFFGVDRGRIAVAQVEAGAAFGRDAGGQGDLDGLLVREIEDDTLGWGKPQLVFEM